MNETAMVGSAQADAEVARLAARLPSRWQRTCKRSIDLVLGVVCSLVTLPVVLFLALLVALTLKASPFFVQSRVGRYGKTFTCIKLRTLPKDTDRYASKYDLPDNPRRLCRVLRLSHLDELPQLWLVVIGTMSLVGPRPEMPNLERRFSDEQRAARNPFRPGCTGSWQVSEDSSGLMFEHPEYDIRYADEFSLVTDFRIMAQTVKAVVMAGFSSI